LEGDAGRDDDELLESCWVLWPEVLSGTRRNGVLGSSWEGVLPVSRSFLGLALPAKRRADRKDARRFSSTGESLESLRSPSPLSSSMLSCLGALDASP
jgi:hypothetical protein